MQNSLPTWVSILSALATPTLALFAIFIALLQWKTAKQKIKLDLFDRRFEVYKNVEKSLLIISGQGKATNVAIKELTRASSIAPMLFPNEMVSKIDAWRFKSVELDAASIQISATKPGSPERMTAVAKERALLKGFIKDLNILGEIFAACMRPVH